MDMDRGINTGAVLIPNFHIFWRIPTPHTLILQVRIEAFGKGLVSTCITDEERVVLDGLAQQGREILNQRLWQATAPEKGQRERHGFGEGAMVEGAWTIVAAGL